MCELFAVNAMMLIFANRIKNKNLRGGTCEKNIAVLQDKISILNQIKQEDDEQWKRNK